MDDDTPQPGQPPAWIDDSWLRRAGNKPAPRWRGVATAILASRPLRAGAVAVLIAASLSGVALLATRPTPVRVDIVSAGGSSAAPVLPSAAGTKTTPTTIPVVQAAPRGPVRVLPLRYEGLMHLTWRVCGSSATWLAQAAANGVTGPDWQILYGTAYEINCARPAIKQPTAPPPPPPAPKAPVVVQGSYWAYPLPGRCDRTDEFGEPRYNPITGQHYAHQGRDLPAPTGTPIHAIHGGTVVFHGDAGRGGLQVQIRDGSLLVKYNHLSRFSVSGGNVVSAGQVIGYVGMTGDATVPHLHLEIWLNGKLRNPTTFLNQYQVRLAC